ncbi:DNA gyrase subunit A [Candidatus Adlerbacteria bacterium RIFOXYC1_FULL_48_26]|uniref:DNA gyrase subunit A n=1 Tax=Candidatus Adlerbacteria bacterium RIFOXYC1_FULL_48_26 TaxID=1797247 RepID=A0A1F4Y2W0_9BACT|nr:MAG: DNA gyrase subunit A [Candidatus Adlerbacteria bacterium RIFOXYC1_FULL_48_26]OGC93510.1 MAG: DNA gyrase subunit A [Candidatus Adlerbacteria bacterium RIFOXYB1_FULL_48_10]
MAKQETNPPAGAEQNPQGIVARNISTEMRESYLDYAMSVITSRALPDVRDGLKPVHRRILYAMHRMGLTPGARFRKSAAVVGDVLGKYHPHGDASVYDAMVKMAQDFSMRYPLILGQGNFGSIDGDSAAAMRYTEAKMSRMSELLLNDLEKDTVNWRPNYDATQQEPEVLPATVPNILLNGTLGIAVGMATSIPPHNLTEVTNALTHLIENPDATTEDLMEFVSGPDFPTGAVAYNKKDLLHAYSTGKGGVVVRGNAEIVENKKGDFQIVITSIPYRVNKADLIMRIADLVRDKKLEGVRGLRDESTKDIRVVIDLKGGAHPQKVLNFLYKHTAIEDTFHFNMVVLADGIPQTMSLKGILQEFIKHRREVVKRRTEFDLKKAQEREHILLGLTKALDHIDEVIKIIRASKDVGEAEVNLIKKFKFTSIQAQAILEMRLSRLANLERKKVENELDEVQARIKEWTILLASDKKMLGVVKEEIVVAAKRFADDRKTKVMKGSAGVINVEDLVTDEEQVLVLTAGGYVKRTNPEEFRRQKRGGVGVIDLNTKEEDFVTTFLTTSTHSDLLFFSDLGKAYQIKMYDVPEGKRSTKGKAVVNFLSITDAEKISSVLPMRKIEKEGEKFLYMITKQGVAKKVDAASFHDVRRSGLIAIKLQKGDELIAALLVEKGDEIFLSSAKGQSIRFKESDIRPMGRSAGGVRGMKLGSGDFIVGADVVQKGAKNVEVLVVSKNGYGKTTPADEYKVQNRGGSGIKTVKVTPKTGPLIAARVISKTDDSDAEMVVISQKGQVIRTGVNEIPSLSRGTQGVRIMKLRDGDAIASFVCL